MLSLHHKDTAMEKSILKKYKADKIVFFICLIISVGLIVGGFFVPPMGVIDGSILMAVGELFAFAALGVGAQAIADGRKVKVNKGDVEINVNETED